MAWLPHATCVRHAFVTQHCTTMFRSEEINGTTSPLKKSVVGQLSLVHIVSRWAFYSPNFTSLHRQLLVCHCKCAAPLSSPLIFASIKGLFSTSLFCSLIHRDQLHTRSTELLAGLPSCVVTCVPQSPLGLCLSVESVDEPAKLQLRRTEEITTQ